MIVYYDKDGSEIPRMEFLRKFNDPDYVRVALDEVGEAWISTVWMGLNHAMPPNLTPPLIFETMVGGGEYDGKQVRYATLEEAEHGHRAVVAELHENRPRVHWWPVAVIALTAIFCLSMLAFAITHT